MVREIEKEFVDVKIIHEYPYLRSDVVSIRVNKENLCFREGMAVAKAIVTYKGMDSKFYTYECMGVINENFEECFDDQHFEGEDLMFLPCNKEIMRCGDHDFIVRVEKENAIQNGVEYHHIRIYSKVPMLVNRDLVKQPFGTILPTDKEEIIVAGNQFYSVSTCSYLTRPLTSIEKAEGYPRVFLIRDFIKPENMETEDFSEYLQFSMNTSFELESGILSSGKLDFIGFPKTFAEYEMVRLSRLKELLQEGEKYNNYLRAMRYKK